MCAHTHRSQTDKKETLMFDNLFSSRLNKFANGTKSKNKENMKLEYSSCSYYK